MNHRCLYLRVIAVLFIALGLLGCSFAINPEKAFTEEYLSMTPEEYEGRDSKIRELSKEKIRELFHLAYQHGNVPLAEYYLTLGADLSDNNHKNKEFAINLIENISEGENHHLLLSIVEEDPDFLKWQIPIRRGGGSRNILTYYVLRRSYDETIKLLEMVDDVDILNGNGSTPLMILSARIEDVEEKHKKMNALIRKGADLTVITKDKMEFYSLTGRNILHYFSWWPEEEDYTPILKQIVAAGVDVNKQDDWGETPLHTAVYPSAFRTNSPAYVRFLLENGADKTLRDSTNTPPIHFFDGPYQRIDKVTDPEKKKVVDEITALLALE